MVEFKLPDLGEGVAEGEIVKWLVSDGQEIKEDQPMVEVMTDKATVQIPSPVNARVRQILTKEGQTVTVGTSLVILDNGGAQPVPSGKAVQAEQEKQKAGPVSPAASTRVIATPALRKLARDLGVEIETVRGSGGSGRILEDDVRKAAASKGSIQTFRPVQIERAPGAIASTSPGMEEHISIHGIRKRIAEKMMKSVSTTAPVTHVEEVDFSELVAMREKSKPLAEAKGVKLTFLPFIIKSVVAALKQYPYFNASFDEEKQEIVVKHYYNIGFATDTPNGLIVPVLKDADRKTILEIAREILSLSESARTGKIQLEDIQGGTFTITNIGVLGGISSTPIINVPEVAILGVHKIQKRPVVRGEQIVIRDIANVALTFDHRVQDGADAARFTGLITKFLESPGLLLLESQLGLQ